MVGTWHYLRDGQQVGPISQDEFYTLVQHGVITGDTKVWCEGWSHWVSYSDYTASQDLQNTAADAQKKGGGKGLKVTLSIAGGLLVIGGVLLIVLLSSKSAPVIDIPGDDDRRLMDLSETEKTEACRSFIGQLSDLANEHKGNICSVKALVDSKGDRDECRRTRKRCLREVNAEFSKLGGDCDDTSEGNVKDCKATIGELEMCVSEAYEVIMDAAGPMLELSCSSDMADFMGAIGKVVDGVGLDMNDLQGAGMGGMAQEELQEKILRMVPACAVIREKCFGEAYQRRSNTTEAIDQLDKIYKGAAFYYTAPKVAPGTGIKLPCQFPTDAFCIPEGSPCDYPDEKYPADPDIWTTPTWSALSFQMNDSHYFKYCFDSEGTLSNAIMTASAHADLDCDGTFSTFQRLGYGDPQATHSECAIRGSAAFYVENETE
jgi:hypothetical protein